MKTSLTFSALFFSLALPAALAADVLGVMSALTLKPTILFGALVISFILLTVVGDYSRAPRLASRPTRHPAAKVPAKAAHPLAA